VAQGLLIALEGIDGAGKTTQARLLAATLQKMKQLQQLEQEAVLTQEPTQGVVGQKLRSYLLGPSRNLSPEEELHLFIMDRKEHVAEVIKPALAQGKVVICDRYYYSSAAYQGALGLDPAAIIAANEAFAPRPDLVFILTLPIPQALQRLSKKGKEGLQVSESLHYLKQVAAIYDSFKGPQFRRLEATPDPMALHQLILAQTRKVLQEIK
jgi:dTMP kinase